MEKKIIKNNKIDREPGKITIMTSSSKVYI